eukprot:COSAG02_NODE_3041_length_7489_cov_7.290798_12_plen_174_part_00
MAVALDLPRHAQESNINKTATQQNVHNDATWQAFGELSKEMRYAKLAADYHHTDVCCCLQTQEKEEAFLMQHLCARNRSIVHFVFVARSLPRGRLELEAVVAERDEFLDQELLDRYAAIAAEATEPDGPAAHVRKKRKTRSPFIRSPCGFQPDDGKRSFAKTGSGQASGKLKY